MFKATERKNFSLSNMGASEEPRRSSCSLQNNISKKIYVLSVVVRRPFRDSGGKTANALLRYGVFGTQVRSSGIEKDAEA